MIPYRMNPMGISRSAEIPTDGMVFYASLSSDNAYAETGQTLSKTGTVSYSTVNGIPCAYFNGGSCLLATSPFSGGKISFSFCGWAKASSATSVYKSCFYVGDRPRTYYKCAGLFYYSETGVDFSSANDELQQTGLVTQTDWTFFILEQDAELKISSLYINGTKTLYKTREIDLLTDRLAIGSQTVPSDYFNGYVASVRFYNRLLSGQEIQLLSQEHNPTT